MRVAVYLTPSPAGVLHLLDLLTALSLRRPGFAAVRKDEREDSDTYCYSCLLRYFSLSWKVVVHGEKYPAPSFLIYFPVLNTDDTKISSNDSISQG